MVLSTVLTVGIQGQRQFLSSSSFGHVVPYAASRLLVSLIFYNPNKLTL